MNNNNTQFVPYKPLPQLPPKRQPPLPPQQQQKQLPKQDISNTIIVEKQPIKYSSNNGQTSQPINNNNNQSLFQMYRKPNVTLPPTPTPTPQPLQISPDTSSNNNSLLQDNGKSDTSNKHNNNSGNGWKFANTPVNRVRAASNLPAPIHYQSPIITLNSSSSSSSSPSNSLKSSPSSPTLPKRVLQKPLPITPITPIKSFLNNNPNYTHMELPQHSRLKQTQQQHQQSSSLPSNSILSQMAASKFNNQIQTTTNNNHHQINNNDLSSSPLQQNNNNNNYNNNYGNNSNLAVTNSLTSLTNNINSYSNNGINTNVQLIPLTTTVSPTSTLTSSNLHSQTSTTNSSNSNNNSPQLSPLQSPTSPRKQTLIGKFKGFINTPINNNTNINDYIVSSSANLNNTTSSSIATTTNNNSNNNNNNYNSDSNNQSGDISNSINSNYYIMTKEKKISSEDIIKIFDLPKNEVILSEHPCAYRKKVSKAGKLYITTSYFCFYSLIFNSEIKEHQAFKDIKNIKKVTSIILGSSIEISTKDFKYVFGLFDSTDSAYWALMKQFSHYQSLSEVKPIAFLTKRLSLHNIFSISNDFGNEDQNNNAPPVGKSRKTKSIIINESEKNNEGRVRFTSMSAIQKDGAVVPLESNLMRTRSGSLPSYATTKRKKIKESFSQLIQTINKRQSPPPIPDFQQQFNKDDNNSYSTENNNNNNNNTSSTTTTTTTSTLKSTSTTKTNDSSFSPVFEENGASSTSPKNTVSNNILEQLTIKSTGSSVDNGETKSISPPIQRMKLKNRSITFGCDLNKDFKMDERSIITKEKEKEKEISTPSNSTSNQSSTPTANSPPRDLRDRSNSIFNIMKNRKKITKNKESEDKLSQMLISRRSKYDAAQLYLNEDVIGIPIEQLRIDDTGCPLFASMLFNHLESLVTETNQANTITIQSIYLSHIFGNPTRLSNNGSNGTGSAATPNGNGNTQLFVEEITEDQMEMELENNNCSQSANGLSSSSALKNRNGALERLLIRTKRGKEDVYKELGSSPRVIGELLKHFLRSLPQPLMPEQLLTCLEVEDHQYKISMIRSLIYSQQQAAWTLFRMMICHFVKLADQYSSCYRSSILTPDLNSLASSSSSVNNIGLYLSKQEIYEYISTIFGPLIIGTENDELNSTSTNSSTPDNNNSPSNYKKSIDTLLFILLNHLDFICDSINGVQYGIKKGKQIVKSAPIDQLIIKLTDVHYRDDTLLDTFNLTHEDYFISSTEYVERLFDLYNKSTEQKCIDSPWRLAVRERILYLIRKLMESKQRSYWQATDPVGSKLLLSIRQLISDNLKLRISSYEENKQLLQLDEYCKQQTDFSTIIFNSNSNSNSSNKSTTTTPNSSAPSTPTLSSTSSSVNTSPVSASPKKSKNDFILAATRTMPTRKFTVVDSDSAEVSIQIALLDEQTFSALHVSELLLNRFAKPAESPCFQAMVASFNRWSSWVGSEVVGATSSSARAALFERFIEIASNLLELNDFHGSYAITMGLQHYAIRRLTLSWEKVSRKSMSSYQSLQRLFATDANHKAYRERLHSAKSPLVPYIGIYSKDLFAVGDASPTTLKDNNYNDNNNNSYSNVTILNLDKMRQIQSILHLLQSYRQSSYPMKSVSTLQNKILDRQILNDDEMYEKSLLLEPRQQQ
ncbi:RasGEF domain-containing protein [Heterostelium album PN500]|uniref:RasGEF domain-containing protein n=1 Tax=Heterostelium pallidum (strain ATCC 26659 / Pp 5 / PN500) TaxID=670386 RepID=D3BUL2_HETP5|nr:RasGEF domain-containing protein [Heterostelium album PN500]EFA74800.1 RasGEF domain-containing protein [Heterostelium album PN500]|eukprot:XP_020426934.1 RasGEF domain-containing protein [Heterostelium album PN500]